MADRFSGIFAIRSRHRHVDIKPIGEKIVRHGIIGVLLAVASASWGSSAVAATESEMVNAPGACQGALPSYEGALRKRPLGIANEGASPAFVTCALADRGTMPYHLQLGFLNRSADEVVVSCTMVSGYTATAGVELGVSYIPKSMSIPASDGRFINWVANYDTDSDHFTAPTSFSCLLPAGAEINFIYKSSGDNPFSSKSKR